MTHIDKIAESQREYAARPWLAYIHRRYSSAGHRFNTIEAAIQYTNDQHNRELDDLGTDRDYWVEFKFHGILMEDL
jgi:hypothetical protein